MIVFYTSSLRKTNATLYLACYLETSIARNE